MTDKELIKQEIERRFNDNMKASEQYTENSKSRALFTSAAKEDYDLIAFIESLPEEPASENRINECLYWDKDWGCSTSPMNKCDTCPRAKWVEVKEEKKNLNERYKRIVQTEQFKESYCDKSLGEEEPGCEVNFTTKSEE